MNEKRLKLIAMDAEDLQVISAHCQDAVTKTGHLKYLAGENRFVLEMNRFVWENISHKRSIPERRRSVLHFDRVQKVSSSGIDLSAQETVLSLLAMKFEETDAPGGVLELIFSGESTIRLQVECIEAQLADMQAAWAASSKPRHPEN